MSSDSSLFQPSRASSVAVPAASGQSSSAAWCGQPAFPATSAAALATVAASTGSVSTRRLLSRECGKSGSSTANPPGTAPTPTARRTGSEA
jgi:hypothetical protein